MTQRLTLDSSIIASSLLPKETSHTLCKKVMLAVDQGFFNAIQPYTVITEIVAAIFRRTKDVTEAKRIAKLLLELPPSFQYVNISKESTQNANDIVLRTGLRGMDAIVVQVARQEGSTLLTLDKEMGKYAQKVVHVVALSELEKELDEMLTA